MPKIIVTYRSCDGYRETRSYKTLAGAQKFARHWVGDRPEICHSYAVSFDGIGVVSVDGESIHKLFCSSQVEV